MFKLVAPRDLGPIPAAAATAFVALAIFAWTERTVLVDPGGMSVPYWPWKLWQIGPLLMGIGGAWWIWLSTRRVPWVRSLALGILALVVLANGYSDLFGDYRVTCGAPSTRCSSVPRAWRRWLYGAPDTLRGKWARWFRQRWAPWFSPMHTSSTTGCLADTGPGANAYGTGLGRRRQPGQRRHSRKW